MTQVLLTQVLVDPEEKDFQLMLVHMTEKGKVISTHDVILHNSMDRFVHTVGEP